MHPRLHRTHGLLLVLGASLATTPGVAQDTTHEAVSTADASAEEATAAAASAEEATAAGASDGAGGGIEGRYAAQVFAGVQATVRRDSASALESLRAAAALLPDRPEAYCRTGDAQRMAGSLVEAVLAYESCSRFAYAAEDLAHGDLGRVGQGITLERIPGRADEARAVYSRLLTDSRREAVVALAEARLRAMDDRVCYGLGFTGHGLGTTRLAGRILAHMALDRATDLLDLPLVRRRPFPYPPEPIRTWAVNQVTRALRRVDAGHSPSLLLRLLDRFGIGFSS